MPKNPPKASKISVLCNMVGHRYRVSRTVSEQIHEYKCAICKHEITEDMNGRIKELDSRYKSINDTLSIFIEKRTRRLSV